MVSRRLDRAHLAAVGLDGDEANAKRLALPGKVIDCGRGKSGAPVAHENDDYRAAAAALELREMAATLGYLEPLQIGISRGLIHSGAYGGPHRRTFAVMGNEVNISARLMSRRRAAR